MIIEIIQQLKIVSQKPIKVYFVNENAIDDDTKNIPKKIFLAQSAQMDCCCNNTIVKTEQAENPEQE